MGQPHTQEITNDFLKSEKSNIHFLSLYIRFINECIYQCSGRDNDIGISIESELFSSISLVRSMHTHLLTRNLLLNNVLDYPNNELLNEFDDQIEDLKYLLQKTNRSNTYKQMCHKRMDDFFGYHFKNSIKGYIGSKPIFHNPW